MKNRITTLLIVGFVVFVTTGFMLAGKPENGKGGHEIKIRIKNVKDSLVYLYHHYGEKQKAVDTAVLGPNGDCVFKGDDELGGGIYIVYVPDKVYFEIIVNEQNFSIETDTGDFIANMHIKGSVENTIFNEYQKFRKTMFERNTAMKTRLDANKENADSSRIIKDEMKKLGEDTESYTLGLFNKYPDTFFAKMLKMTKPIDIPEAPKDAEGHIIDSNFALHYHQEHYFDNIDFSDECILRTPIYNQKINDYLKMLTHPAPDSVIHSIDFIINKSRKNEEVFRYTLATLYNKYNTSKIMGYDAIFIHIAEKYYMSGEADWADPEFVKEITKRVNEISPTIIGNKATDIVLVDTLGRRIPLYSVDAKFTILFFYEPSCGHCKKTAPKVKKLYDAAKEHGVEVYAVCTKSEADEWKKFIRTFELTWINVADPNHQSNYRNFYDVRSTPILYLLDKDKKIIAKRLSPNQLGKMLSRELGVELPEIEEDEDHKSDDKKEDEH